MQLCFLLSIFSSRLAQRKWKIGFFSLLWHTKPADIFLLEEGMSFSCLSGLSGLCCNNKQILKFQWLSTYTYSYLHMFISFTYAPCTLQTSSIPEVLQGASWFSSCDSVFSTRSLCDHAAAAAKLLQSCPTLWDPRDGSPPGFPIPGILQARTLEWVDISFSNAWKWKVKGDSLSRSGLLATPWTAAHQVPPSMDFPGKSTGVGCHCLLRIKQLKVAYSQEFN